MLEQFKQGPLKMFSHKNFLKVLPLIENGSLLLKRPNLDKALWNWADAVLNGTD